MVYLCLRLGPSEGQGRSKDFFQEGAKLGGPKVNPCKNGKVTGFDPLFLKGPILTK